MKFSRLYFLFIFSLILEQISLASVPWRVNFSGFLTDPLGTSYSGNLDVTVSIFEASTGGSSIYTEYLGPIEFNSGDCAFDFGTDTEAFRSALGGLQAWLEIRVGSDTLAPRVRLLSVPYALVSAGVNFPGGSQLRMHGNDLILVNPDGKTNLVHTEPFGMAHAPVVMESGADSVEDLTEVNSVSNSNESSHNQLVDSIATSFDGYKFLTGIVSSASIDSSYEIKVTTDLSKVSIKAGGSPADMVLIPAAGNGFFMGESKPIDKYKNHIPKHEVKFTRNFYMDKYEVSWSRWQMVFNWALSNGYTFEGCIAAGRAGDYPVYRVGWIDAIKWCNARSEMEGLTPVYYSSSSHERANVIRSGQVQVIPPQNCLKDADGYRLPTEAEWEYAAAGGAENDKFPWGPALQSGFATYGKKSHDLVTSNNPGNFGLHNMGGNVFEWVYELYYRYTTVTQTDPWQPGPDISKGKEHITKGGAFNSKISRLYCAHRWPRADRWVRLKPITRDLHGFRSVRSVLDDGRP